MTAPYTQRLLNIARTCDEGSRVSESFRSMQALIARKAPLFMKVGHFTSKAEYKPSVGRQGVRIPDEKRARVRAMLAGGMSTGQIALKLNINIQSVRNIKKEAK